MKPKVTVKGKARELTLTPEQRDVLLGAKHDGGGNEQLFGRLAYEVKTRADGTIFTKVYPDDMVRLEKLEARTDPGTWQDWAKEVLAANRQTN